MQMAKNMVNIHYSSLPYISMTLLHIFILKLYSPPASPSAWEGAGIIYQK